MLKTVRRKRKHRQPDVNALANFCFPFVSAYRTFCLVPNAEFRQVLDQIRELALAV